MNDSPLTDLGELWREQSAEGLELSAEEIHARVERLARCSRRAKLDGYLVVGVIGTCFVGFMLLIDNLLLRIGSVLTILGLAVIAWQARSRQLAEREATRQAAESGDVSSLDFHLGQLRRTRDWHRGATFWARWLAMLPGGPIFFIGFAQARPDLVPIIRLEALTFVLAILAAIPLQRRAARSYQRQIERLERLKVEQESLRSH